jgi:predicted DNA-binding transcriptional regulator AlpA
MDDELRRCLSKKEAASYVGVSPNTFMRMVKRGSAPKPIQITERRIVWDKTHLDKMIDGLSS